MKFSLKAIAAAALLALPSAVQAQVDATVPLNVVSNPFPTNGTGYPASGRAGGFLADFTIDFPLKAATFDNYLVWCIDPNRGISVPGGPYAYSAFESYDFAANTMLGGANGHDLTVGDMKRIVGLVSDLHTNWASYSELARVQRQGSIWALFRGETPVLSNLAEASLSGWYVLYNGQNQTFVTYVPEPSSAALVLTGIAAFMMIASKRRRRV